MSIQLKKNLYQLVLVFFAMLLFISCQKGIKDVNTTPVIPDNETPDLASKVSSSVSGFVTDENDAPVIGASVHVGMVSTTTDSYGYFKVANADVVKNAAVVTVNQPGYFKGIKTYIATAGKAAFFRIKLLPKITAGSITASAGGDIVLVNGLKISFPANAIVDASTGTAYAGIVNAAAHWIDPTATDLNQIMPGDLRGINDAGGLRTLTSYGMAAVELTGAAGELLQIATGKKATLTIPFSAAIAASAPASIPLWYFDETVGLWKQEGTAVKTGNAYVGDVAHFSFWNCDMPNNYIHFDCTVVDGSGQPIPYTLVKVSVVGNPYSAGYGYTDSSGYAGGAVPNDAQLLLEIFSYSNCGLPVYSQNFSTTGTSLSLGNITVTNSAQFVANITGTVTDCNNAAVSNGYIIMLKDNQYFRQNLSSSGSFDLNALLCTGSSANIILIGEDNAGGQQSAPLAYTISASSNVIGNLQACGVTTDQFVNYTINSENYSYTSPVDSFYQFFNTQVNPPAIEISAQNYTAGSTNFVTIGFSESGIGAGSVQELTRFWPEQLNDTLSITTPVNVNITEYGNIGQFISGNFSGTLTGRPPSSTAYNVSCGFRIRRTN